MAKWIGRVSGAAVVGFAAYGVFTYFSQGYHTRPDVPEGGFSITFNSGLRAIVEGVTQDRQNKRYLGVPYDVPEWAEDRWAMCQPPGEDETDDLPRKVDLGPGSRLEALCRVDGEGETVLRGAIYSAPRT